MYVISSVIALAKSEICGKHMKTAANTSIAQLAQSEAIGNGTQKTENTRRAVSETPCLPAKLIR